MARRISAVSLSLSGVDDALDTIEDLIRRGESMEPAFHRIVALLRQVERQQFASGKGWRRLAPGTVAAKRRRAQDPRRLVMTGRLRRSLTGPTSDSKVDVDRDSVFFGTRLFYSRFQLGTNHSPRRRPVIVRKPTRADAIDLLRQHLTAGLA